ncbi:signal peptidase I [Vagococcus sp. JNUCC 83]
MKKKKSSNHNNPRSRQSKKNIPNRGLKAKVIIIFGDILFYLFFFILIIGAVVFNFNDSPDKSFFGYRFMTVLTNSMAPNPEKPELKDGFVSGSIIVIKQVNPKELKKGDIITFYPVKGKTEAYLTHRIIEKRNELDGEKGTYFVTQGDANTGSDIPIDSDQVVGKVMVSIPLVGSVLDFIRSNIVVVVIFVSLLFGFILMLKYYVSMKPTQKNRSMTSAKSRGRKKRKHLKKR